MVDHTEKQINALKNASKKKREDTINRVRNALEEMEKNNIPITFRSVSKMANVSRYWLYEEPEMKAYINQQRSKSAIIKKTLDQQKVIDRKDAEISILKKRIESMQNELQQLKSQLEIAYGEIYSKK